MIGAKTKTRRNIYADIKKHQLKQAEKRERVEQWYFVGLCVIGYVAYVLFCCL